MFGTSEQVKQEYDRISQTWRQKIWVSDKNFKEKIVAFAATTGDEELLDVGVGSGDFSGLLGVKTVTGMDISEKMLRECQRLHPGFNLVWGDGERLPFLNCAFSMVCCRNYLQNFEDPTQAFAEMERVLKPGGKIVVVESAVYEEERRFPTDFVRVAEPFHPMFPGHEQLRGLFEQHNLKDIKQKVVGVHKKWFQKWRLSKDTTPEQRKLGYKVCEQYPHWYKEKYQMIFFPEEQEIESTLTFSFLKGIKE